MKSNISATVFVIFVLFLFISPEAKERQKTEWKGKIEKQLAEFPFDVTRKILEKKVISEREAYRRVVWVTHGYEHDLSISKIDGQTFNFSLLSSD